MRSVRNTQERMQSITVPYTTLSGVENVYMQNMTTGKMKLNLSDIAPKIQKKSTALNTLLNQIRKSEDEKAESETHKKLSKGEKKL